jgi:hypothetical protein
MRTTPHKGHASTHNPWAWGPWLASQTRKPPPLAGLGRGSKQKTGNLPGTLQASYAIRPRCKRCDVKLSTIEVPRKHVMALASLLDAESHAAKQAPTFRTYVQTPLYQCWILLYEHNYAVCRRRVHVRHYRWSNRWNEMLLSCLKEHRIE